MIDYTKIKESFIKWIVDYSGINETGRHIWLFPKAPRPAPPYVGINIINGPIKLGLNDSYVYNKDTNLYVICGTREFNMSVNVFGKKSLDYATNLTLSLELDDVKQFFRKIPVGLGASTPNILNSTALLDTIYEDRQTFDLKFYTTFSIETTVPRISTVDILGSFDDGEQEVPINVTE